MCPQINSRIKKLQKSSKHKGLIAPEFFEDIDMEVVDKQLLPKKVEVNIEEGNSEMLINQLFN